MYQIRKKELYLPCQKNINMESTDFATKNKKFKPYYKEFSGLDVQQMREIITHLFSLMLEKEKQSERTKDANILSKFKPSSEITDEERKYAAEQLSKMTFSPHTNDLVDGLSISNEELQDERTRYILGRQHLPNSTMLW